MTVKRLRMEAEFEPDCAVDFQFPLTGAGQKLTPVAITNVHTGTNDW